MNIEETQDKPKTEERPRGNRGEVGAATAAALLKQRYHQSHFLREGAGDKRNPSKMVWVAKEGAPSLKKFARKLLATGDENAKDFFAHKKGSLNQTRSPANVKAATEAGMATRMEKRKKSANKSKP